MGIKKSRLLNRILMYTLNIFLAVVFLAPLVWMVVSSVKPEVNIFADMTSVRAFLPISGSLDNYRSILEKGEIVRTMLNSLYYVTIMIGLGLIVNSMCGFALAKLQFRGRDFLFSLIVALIIIPLESIILPLYFMIFKFKMLNTFSALIAPFTANCFSIFLFRQFFVDIPDSLLEAAYIDGASPLKAFFKIVLPLAFPVYATVLILQFIEHWGDFLWPVLVTDDRTKTVQLGLQTLFTAPPVHYGPIFAALTLSTLPVVVMFIFFQKYYVQGIAQSGIKG